MAASEAVVEQFGIEEAALTDWSATYEARENVKVARHMQNAFRAGYRAAKRGEKPVGGDGQQAKLEALAVAQERLREAERTLEIVRALEQQMEDGVIARTAPEAWIPRAFNEVEVDALTTGLLLVRRSAMEDVEHAKARLEGMLK